MNNFFFNENLRVDGTDLNDDTTNNIVILLSVVIPTSLIYLEVCNSPKTKLNAWICYCLAFFILYSHAPVCDFFLHS